MGVGVGVWVGLVGIILTPEIKDRRGRPQGSLCCLVSGSSLVLKSYQLGVGSRSGGIQGVFSPEEPDLILAAEELRICSGKVNTTTPPQSACPLHPQPRSPLIPFIGC